MNHRIVTKQYHIALFSTCVLIILLPVTYIIVHQTYPPRYRVVTYRYIPILSTLVNHATNTGMTLLPILLYPWARILVQVMIYRRLLIGRDGHLDQSEAYDIS